jgi:hypothetical protein
MSGQCVCPTGSPNVCADPTNINFAGKCTNVLTDVLNCGECGVVCPEPTGPDAPCLVRACINGSCQFVNTPNGTPCNDFDACTQTDTCQNGRCVGSNRIICTALDQCHDVGTCDPATGLCSNPAKPNGTACDDGDQCTVNDTCQGGFCTPGAPRNCDDGNPCTVDTCDPATGCVHANAPNNTPCGANQICCEPPSGTSVCVSSNTTTNCGTCGTVCTTNVANAHPVCSLGTCRFECDAGFKECAGACIPTTGCCTNLDCDDGNPCTTDTCDQTSHTCSHTPIANCCQTAADCPTPTNQCKQAACVSNVCVEQNKANGTTCNDGNPCTTNDVCTGGTCAGTPVACTAGTTCVSGTCVCNTTSGCTGCCQSNTCQAGTAQGACGSNGVTCQACATMGTGQQICSSQNNGGVFRCCRAAGRPCNPMNPNMCCSKSCPSSTSTCSP